jgi:hypothetical protein
MYTHTNRKEKKKIDNTVDWNRRNILQRGSGGYSSHQAGLTDSPRLLCLVWLSGLKWCLFSYNCKFTISCLWNYTSQLLGQPVTHSAPTFTSYLLVAVWMIIFWSMKKEGKKVKVKLSLCLTTYALRHEGVCGSGCIDPNCLDLGTSWRWVVSFTPLPLYLRWKSPRYPLDRRLGGPQSRSGRSVNEKILYSSGTRTPTPRSSSP